jgi:hypothetical protein
MGRDTGAAMAETLNSIMELRFKPVFERYLGVTGPAAQLI